MASQAKRLKDYRLYRLLFIALAIFAALFLASSQRSFVRPVQALSSGIVISQVYGGGRNAGATLTHDLIELFNRGKSAVSLTRWPVPHASAAGTTSHGAPLTHVTI